MKKPKLWIILVFITLAISLLCACATLDHFFGYDVGSEGLVPGSPAADVQGALSSGLFGPGAAALSGLLSAAGAAYFSIRKAQQKDNEGHEAHKENVSEILELKARIAVLEKMVSSSQA